MSEHTRKREVRRELVPFGERLTQLRRAAGISQERLAELAGVERAYVSSAETGRRNATLTTLYKLAAALNVDPGELISGTAPSNSSL
jgi:transcriptional regulator with XRE-family HTH domain